MSQCLPVDLLQEDHEDAGGAGDLPCQPFSSGFLSRLPGCQVREQRVFLLRRRKGSIRFIHSSKFKFSYFIDSRRDSVSDYNELGGGIATRRVRRCDISGARLRQDGWSNTTKGVPVPYCDKTGVQRLPEPFKRPLGEGNRGFLSPFSSKSSTALYLDREHCDVWGASLTRHDRPACRSIA